MEFHKWFDGCFLTTPQADLPRDTLDLPASPGVCLFATERDKPILLLDGANLRAMVRRRLTEQENGRLNRRTRLRPIVRRIWFRRCWSAFETHVSYFRIAREVFPDRYEEWFPRLKAWWVRLDPRARYPFFEKTTHWEGDTHRIWGPFADAKTAAGCVEILREVFDLCRCPERLQRGERPDGCPYAQMQRCAAVCRGTVSIPDYRAALEQAAACLDSTPKETLHGLEQQMEEQSAALRFEEAQRLKQKIDKLKGLLAPAYRWVAPRDDFSVLAFQPGPPRRSPGRRDRRPTITGFLIGPGRVDQLDSFNAEEVEAGCRNLLDHLRLAQFQEHPNPPEAVRERLMAWLTHLLYHRKKTDRGLYLVYRESLTAAPLAKIVRAHFSRKTETKESKPELDSFSLSAADDQTGHPDNPPSPD